ncbi:MAG: sulfurtransferase [Chromatiales bacterium]|nr:sulfurtransferase [Chromatiales bacterium]
MFIKEIDARSLADRLNAGDDLMLIDVRSGPEVAQGMIEGGQHVPMHLLPLRLADIPRNKDVVFYCRSGARSAQVCMWLGQQGFDNVVNLRGGVIAWAREGLSFVLPDQRMYA